MKFKLDPSSRQGTGGREDKIGGFIDRFSNSCVNWVIFNHLLRNDNFHIDPDYFFYNKKSAKRCADIIGLKGQSGKLVPFTFFEKEVPSISIFNLDLVTNFSKIKNIF